jgi:hypothetical protein
MAVSGSAQLMGPPEGSFELGKYTVRVPYRVLVTDRNDGPLIVLGASGLPALYSEYSFGNESNADMLLRRYEPKHISTPGALAWRVDCVYETPQQKEEKSGAGTSSRNSGGGTGRERAGQFENPLLEWPIVKTHSAGREALITRIYDNITNSFKPCTASNGEVFDPPPKYLQTFFTLEITRNEPITAAHLSIEATYTNAVNSDVFWGIAAGYWRIKEITCERQDRQLPNTPFKFAFLRVTYTIEFNPETWDLFLLDHGTYYWKRPANDNNGLPTAGGNQPAEKKTIQTADGHPTSAPLNGRGQPLPDRRPYTPRQTTDPSFSIAKMTPTYAFTDGDLVMFSGLPRQDETTVTAPSGISYNTAYYVRDVVTAADGSQTFNVATTASGTRISLADTGTGHQYIYVPGVFFTIRPYSRVAFSGLGLPQSFALVQ